jgi:hypothetical protein
VMVTRASGRWPLLAVGLGRPGTASATRHQPESVDGVLRRHPGSCCRLRLPVAGRSHGLAPPSSKQGLERPSAQVLVRAKPQRTRPRTG